MQYFGSTAERFKDGAYVTLAPGPGTYDRMQRVVVKSDWSGADRFEAAAASSQAFPGPGEYEPGTSDGKTSGPTGTCSILGSTGRLAFGSMETKRGIVACGGAGGPGPGPGEYPPRSDFAGPGD